MPDWLSDPGPMIAMDLSIWVIAMRITVSAILGGFIALTYRYSHGSQRGSDVWILGTTLVLLATLIAMVTLVIGNSVARAFSLVGALSIVRFRTLVSDTRDTAFVIFAVVVGMAVGSGYALVPIVGLPVAAMIAIGMHSWSGFTGKGSSGAQLVPMEVMIRIAIDQDFQAITRPIFDKYVSSYKLLSANTSRQGASIDLTYELKLVSGSDPIGMVKDLIAIQAVQSVDAKNAA